MNTLEIKNLSKKYSKNAPWSIKDISFTCKPGEIIGILGANGAGKSTTLKCITGMIDYNEGSIEICGYNLKTNPIKAKSSFSFVTDNHIVFEKMTGLQYLSFMSDIYNVSNEDRDALYKQLDDIFHLGENLYQLISSYSHGMKQKICMMGSLMHSPKLWILDEPLLGLDPTTQEALLNFMREYVKDNTKSILFSSHNLDAVKKLCTKVIIISHGVLIEELELTDEIRSSSTILENYYKNTATNIDNENTNDAI